MKLIVGLGNPGKEYDQTRHNVGFEAVEAFASANDLAWKADTKHVAKVAKGEVDGEQVLLAKPQTFMNGSGQTVQGLASYYKIPLENILIIHDEMDLVPGRMMFVAQGRAAGHNGVADIQERMGTQEVARLRIGVGRPVGQMAKESWVLGVPTKEDQEEIAKTLKTTSDAIEDWIVRGTVRAMNQWN